MKFYAISFCLMLCILPLMAQNSSKTDLPDAVVENERTEYTIEENNKYTVEYSIKIKILNREAENLFFFGSFFEKSSTNLSMNASIFDSKGNLIRKLKKEEFKEEKYDDNVSIHNDTYKMYAEVHHNVYPYTVHFTYTKKSSEKWLSLIDFPHPSHTFSVRESVYIVRCLYDKQVRFIQKNLDYHQPPRYTQAANVHTFVYENIPNIKADEVFLPWHNATVPALIISANKLYNEDSSYGLSTWAEVSNFYSRLNSYQQSLPTEAKTKIAELCTGKTAREKVEVLYDYLQKNYRYVSVQLGIGGFKSFPASYVWANKFGDCKALTNMMLSFLKQAQIPSFPVLIKSSRKPFHLDEKNATQIFNHVILCVPLEKDTVWLECTTDAFPADYIGASNINRKAVLCKGQGGGLVSTPVFTHKDNIDVQKTHFSLRPEGIVFKTEGSVKGIFCDNLLFYQKNTDEINMQKLIKSLFAYPIKKCTQKDFSTYERIGKNIKIPYKIEGVAEKVISQSGKRLFVSLADLRRSDIETVDTSRQRYFDLELGNGFTQIDTITVELPDNYQFESKDNFEHTSKYGKYSFKAAINGRELHFVRSLEWYGGCKNRSELRELADFVQKIVVFERNKLVLKANADSGR